jgi:hypothetical protein
MKQRSAAFHIILISCFTLIGSFFYPLNGGWDYKGYKDYSSQQLVSGGMKGIKYRTGSPDPRILQMPADLDRGLKKDPKNNIGKLAEYLGKGHTDPFLKVKAIHDWVAMNIAYDHEGYRTGKHPEQIPENVLRSRIAVCDGYTNLIRTLCELNGIPSQRITGYARGINYNSASKENIESIHAWNAVKIGEFWYLVDATWSYSKRSKNLNYSDEYLFVPSEMLILTHFPDEKIWQLMERPLSQDEFMEQPNIKPRFLDFFNSPPSLLKRTYSSDGEITLLLPAQKKNTKISVSSHDSIDQAKLKTADGVTRSTNDINNTWIDNNKDKTAVRIIFPKIDTYIITVSGQLSEDSKDGIKLSMSVDIGEFIVFNKTASKKRFPELAYWDTDCRLIEPLYTPLKYNSLVTFHMVIPYADKLDVFNGERDLTFYPINKNGEFRFQVKMPSRAKAGDNKFNIFAKKPGVKYAGRVLMYEFTD